MTARNTKLGLLAASMCILTATAAFAQGARRPVEPAGRYIEPRPTEAAKELAQVTLKAQQKERLAELLVTFAANNLAYATASDYKLAPKVVGLALCIAPEYRQVVLVNGALARDRRPNPIENNLGRKDILKELLDNANTLAKSDSAADKLLSAHLFDVLVTIDPQHEDALFQAEVLRKKDIKPDWRFCEVKTANTIVTPPNPETLAPPVAALKKDQSTIKSMMIMRRADGSMNGMACDVIGTKNVDESTMRVYPTGHAQFVKPVGMQMQTSLDEAVRLIKLKKTTWKPGIMLSFEDKYTGHDGGSAGTAFTVLIRSMIEGFDIDTSFAITGDVTVDDKVRKIGGVGAKLRGAVVDKCKYAAIPAENTEALPDTILLYGERLLWDIQIFEIASTEHAVALLRTDRTKELTEALTVFATVQEELKKVDALNATTRKQIPETQIREKLAKVIKLAPSHLSAKYMLDILDGKKATKLSMTASIYQGMSITYPVTDYLNGGRASLGQKDLATIKQRLAQLQLIAHKDTLPLLRSLVEISDAAFRTSYATGDYQQRQVLFQNLKKRIEDVQGEMEALGTKREVAEKLMREGI